ncbi:T9SS type A sorting domain-containing protein [Lacinutrix sp. WUR7]|uniref:M14 family zinc carboxypeptidase n=1 Tax=Lacinutrix sp. WUR7 TaxID=2653681 RepID=UPI00193CDEE9|nr:M14 family zinc carboxypeptidase [Lacinutrix sp. WUR7]QRM89976.1 T9SS type A sorting domain-containing protein [Lacinutrix sp. WUR7]
MKKITFVALLLLLVTQLTYSQETYKKVSITATPNAIQQLDNEGIDLTCGVIIRNNTIDIELTQYQLDKLTDRGIPYTVLIEDMVAFYSQRAIEDLPRASQELQQMKATAASYRSYSVDEVLNNVGQYNECEEIDWAVPANWNLNDAANYPAETNHFGGCLTYQMVLDELDAMRTQYPGLISVKSDASLVSGESNIAANKQTTFEGRTVYYVRISNDPNVDNPNRPETLYQSLIHSREAATVMNQLYFMWYLLENYNTDPAIQNLLNNQELYFIPVLNPDGFVYNQTNAPNGGGGQRKNRNTTGSNSCSTYLDGIDLNRNSAYYWGNGGSSASACNDTYMGTGPFSENETQIMRDFFLDHDFKLALNHHSYKNAMLHAYAGVNQTNPRPDEYAKYNHDMSYYNRYMHGPSTNVTSLNSGNMNDWMLGGPAGTSANGTATGTGSGKNTMSWTPENGLSSEGTGGSYGGFWPQPSNFVHIAKRAMRMNFIAAYYSGKYAKLHDFNQSDILSLNGDLKFAVENLGQTASDFTVTVTPISANILTVGAPSTQTGMPVLQQNNVNINYTLDPAIQLNDKIEFKVTLTNDYASDNVLYEANIVKHYSPTVLFDGNALSNWSQTTGTWYTTSDAYSSTAITSTNGGTYASNDTKRIQMNGSLDVSGNAKTVIQFYAKWDLERSFDYVQLEGSTNGTTWTPLCGKLTKPGAPDDNNNYSNKSSANNDFQPDYEPLYDGDTQERWNMEEIVIDATDNSFLNNQSTVYLRFEFKTDSNNRNDTYYNMDFEGFTFDDFKVIGIQIPCETTVPTNLSVSNVDANSATVNWDLIPSATYDLRYKENTASTWIDVLDVTSNTYDITGLTTSTPYDVEVRTKCTTSTSAYTSIDFTTTAINYCASEGNNANDDDEWIGNVTLGDINNTTGDDHYSNFTAISTDLDKTATHSISVTKSWKGTEYNEGIIVWIDFNQDGDFDDADEEVVSIAANNTSTVSGNIAIPISALLGNTRMRVSLKYNGLATSCASFQYGEVEDYTVNITDGTLSNSDFDINEISVYPNPFNNNINIKLPNSLSNNSISVELYDISGRLITKLENKHAINNTINVSSLDNLSSGAYFLKIMDNTSNNTVIRKIIK